MLEEAFRMRAFTSSRILRASASTSVPASSLSKRAAISSTSNFTSTTRPCPPLVISSFARSSIPAAFRMALGITIRPALSTETTSVMGGVVDYGIYPFILFYGIMPHGVDVDRRRDDEGVRPSERQGKRTDETQPGVRHAS